MAEDGDETNDGALPIRPDPENIAELEPHQERIERIASVYFEGCRQLARGIRSLKHWMEERRED